MDKVKELDKKIQLLKEMREKLYEMETDINVSNEEYAEYEDDCERLFREIYGYDEFGM